MAMPESIPAPSSSTLQGRVPRRADRRPSPGPLGWIISVPDTHQKTVLAALDKERDVTRAHVLDGDEATGWPPASGWRASR